MATETTSFRHRLSDQICEVLSRKLPQPPFLVWCDPERVWRELVPGTPLLTPKNYRRVRSDRFRILSTRNSKSV
jgi:hypothetical protein